MSSRRTLILIGALVAGLLAAFMTSKYVGGIEDRAQGDVQLTSVVIARGGIGRGSNADEAIAAGAIDVGERRQVDVPADAILRPAEIKGMLAQIDLQPGTIITASMFSNDTVAQNGATAAIAEGMTFQTISFDEVRGVAQLPQPGDYVNITLSGQCTPGTTDFVIGAASEEGGTAPAMESCTASLFQKARIAAVGRSLGSAVAAPTDPAAPETTVPPTSNMITFELPPAAAQVLVAASSSANIQIWLSLVRKDYVPEPIEATRVIPAAGVLGVTPYGTATDSNENG